MSAGSMIIFFYNAVFDTIILVPLSYSCLTAHRHTLGHRLVESLPVMLFTLYS